MQGDRHGKDKISRHPRRGYSARDETSRGPAEVKVGSPYSVSFLIFYLFLAPPLSPSVFPATISATDYISGFFSLAFVISPILYTPTQE